MGKKGFRGVKLNNLSWKGMMEKDTLQRVKSCPEERQEGLLLLTQPEPFSDPARRHLSHLEGPG